MGLTVKSALKFLQLAIAAVVIASSSPARAVTDIMWWHAMSGELGRQLEKLASNLNASQSDYRIVPSYKGNYTETVTAAIFAFRSRSQPAIVQVNEIATATMMAARGAIYPGIRTAASVRTRQPLAAPEPWYRAGVPKPIVNHAFTAELQDDRGLPRMARRSVAMPAGGA